MKKFIVLLALMLAITTAQAAKQSSEVDRYAIRILSNGGTPLSTGVYHTAEDFGSFTPDYNSTAMSCRILGLSNVDGNTYVVGFSIEMDQASCFATVEPFLLSIGYTIIIN